MIYSMTTSSHSDAPRGMEFLYSANRLNVATSRAKMHLRRRRIASSVRGGVPDTAPDATCQRVLQIFGIGIAVVMNMERRHCVYRLRAVDRESVSDTRSFADRVSAQTDRNEDVGVASGLVHLTSRRYRSY